MGRISDIVPSIEKQDRWLIKFDEIARTDIPNVWRGWRNPVHYTNFEALGIDLESASFEQVDHLGETSTPIRATPDPERQSVKSEVEAARQKIALVAEVPIDAVKISIEFGM